MAPGSMVSPDPGAVSRFFLHASTLDRPARRRHRPRWAGRRGRSNTRRSNMSVRGTNDGRAPARPRRAGRRPRLRGVVAVTVALLSVVAFSGAAEAKGSGRAAPRVLTEGLAGPLSIDVTGRGDVLVGQSFSGTASLVSKRGQVTDLVNEPG